MILKTNSALGRAIESAMETKGWDRHELARAMDVDVRTISNWVRIGNITLPRLHKLIELMENDVPPEHWLDGVDKLECVKSCYRERDALIEMMRLVPRKTLLEVMDKSMKNLSTSQRVSVWNHVFGDAKPV